MKKLIITGILFFAVIISTNLSAEKKKFDGLNGKVKVMVRYHYIFKNGRKIYWSKKIHKFNRNGKKTAYYRFNKKNKLKSKTTYKYNSKSKLIQKTYVFGKGRKSVYKYQYDKKGRKKRQVRFYKGKKRSDKRYFYNDDGKIVKILDYRNKKTPLTKKIFKYDKRGNKIREAYYMGGKLRSLKKHKYDKNNNRVLEERYGKNKKLKRKYITYYDKKGNKIETKAIMPDGKIWYGTKYRYKPNGKIKKRMFYNHTGKIQNIIINYYNRRGLERLQVYKKPDGRTAAKLIKKYDRLGNKVYHRFILLIKKGAVKGSYMYVIRYSYYS